MESIWINMPSMQVECLRVAVFKERVVEESEGEWVWFFRANLLGHLILLDEDRADSLNGGLAFILRCLHCLTLHLPSMISIATILALLRLLPAFLPKLLNNLFIKVLI